MRCFKDLFSQVRRAVFAAFMFSGLASVMMLAAPLYGWQLFDRVVPQFNVQSLAVLTGFAVATIAVVLVLEVARSALLLRAAVWLDHVPGRQLFENGIRQASRPRETAADLDALDILRRFTLSHDLVPLLEMPWLPIFLGGLVVIHPLMALVVLGAAFVMICVALWHAKGTHDLHDMVSASFHKRRVFEASFIAWGRLARTMGFSRGASRTWEMINRRFVAGAYRLGKRTLFSRGVVNGIRLVCEFGLLALGAWLVMSGRLTMGGMIAALFLGSRVLATLGHFNDSLPELRKAQRAYARLRRLYNSKLPALVAADRSRPVAVQNNQSAHHDPRGRTVQGAGNISLNNVSMTYPGHSRPALREVDLDLEAGECMAISGPMLSGKSTLVSLMAGAVEATRGKVLLDGREIGRLQSGAAQTPIGYAPDAPVVVEGTVHQNIVRFTSDSLMSAAHAAMRIGVHDVLADLPQEYNADVGTQGCRLSLRQRKAISLARAVHGSPAVVIIDSPETGLSEREMKYLARLLGELHASGITLVLATNEPRFQRLADRIVMLDEGVITAVGPVDEVLDLEDEFTGPHAPWLDSGAILSRFKGPIS